MVPRNEGTGKGARAGLHVPFMLLPPQNATMDADVTAIKTALADISDTELAALIAATYGVPQISPGLLAWMDSAAEWELARQRDFDFPLQPPEAAIPACRNCLRFIDWLLEMP